MKYQGNRIYMFQLLNLLTIKSTNSIEKYNENLWCASLTPWDGNFLSIFYVSTNIKCFMPCTRVLTTFFLLSIFSFLAVNRAQFEGTHTTASQLGECLVHE